MQENGKMVACAHYSILISFDFWFAFEQVLILGSLIAFKKMLWSI